MREKAVNMNMVWTCEQMCAVNEQMPQCGARAQPTAPRSTDRSGKEHHL
jgi:hypothetical protein